MIWQYFRRHWSPWFPQLGSRSAFVRQAVNLWCLKHIPQEKLATSLGTYADQVHVINRFPLPVCRLARAKRCRTFRGVSAKGYCAAKEGLHDLSVKQRGQGHPSRFGRRPCGLTARKLDPVAK